jgi:hypothetical protein
MISRDVIFTRVSCFYSFTPGSSLDGTSLSHDRFHSNYCAFINCLSSYDTESILKKTITKNNFLEDENF